MTSRDKPNGIFASIAIVAFAIILFFPAIFGGKIVAPLDITTTLIEPWAENANGAKPHNHNPSDAVTQYLPYRLFAAKSLKEDGYIGWNPYEMGGYSLAANTMALPGSWTMQLHRFLPFKDAWNLGIIVEFLIAGAGMLVFLRSRNLPWLPCLIGAVAYMANSQFTIWIYHRWTLGSFCWMPWVLWSVVGSLSWKSLTTRQLLLPGFLALALLGGSLQHLAFVVLACGCLFAGAIPGSRFKFLHKEWPAAAGWSIAFALALAMAAFSLLPQISAYLANVQLGHTRGGIGYADGPTQPLIHSLLIPAQIWPWLMGDPQTIDGLKLIKSGFMDLAYLGTIPMLLAIVGLFHKQMPRQAKWLILAGLLIPLTPLVGPLYHRVQLLFLLGGAWMAAEMLARLPQLAPRKMIRGLSIAVVALGAALLIGAVLPAKIRDSVENKVVAKSIAASASSQFGSDKKWIEGRARKWTDRFSLLHPRTAWVYGLLLIGTGGLIFSSRQNPGGAKWGNAAILGATSLELFTLFQTWTTFSDPKNLQPEHPAIEMVRQATGTNRVLQSFPDGRFADIFATPNLLSGYFVASVDAYESIQHPSNSTTLSNEPAETRLTLAGVGTSVQPTDSAASEGTADWPLTLMPGGYALRQNPNVPAPVIAGTGPLPLNPQEILTSLKATTPVPQIQESMNRREFEAPQDSTWIRIAQNWHEGWRWRAAGGNWQPLLKGTDSACWIHLLPADSHHVELQFFPRPHWLFFASLAALLAWLFLIPAIALARRSSR